MNKSSLLLAGILFLSAGFASEAYAKGRRPDPEDGFPDYNKLEYRKKQQDPAKEDAANVTPPPALPSSKSLNAPPKWEPEDDTVPKAPPKPVFMSDDASEPPLPDVIKDTLIQGTTAQ